MTVNALTCIDPVTNLLEIYRQKDKTSAESSRLFHNNWLSRYPRPEKCVHDRGPEFVGHDFQFPLMDAGIRPALSSARNPMSNGVIERVHQTIGQLLRTMIQLSPPTNAQEADHLIDPILRTSTTCLSLHLYRCPWISFARIRRFRTRHVY